MKQSFLSPVNFPVSNLLTHSEDYTAWTGPALVVPGADVGPDGSTPTASRLTDGSATVVESRALAQAIPANAQQYTASVYFRKTTGAANTVGLNLALSGGTPLSISARLNTNSGIATGGTVDDAGTYWRLKASLTNNSTNTNITLTVYPATGANSGTNPGSDNVATIGYAVLAGSQVEKGSAATAYNSTTTTSGAHTTTLADFVRNNDVPFIHDLFDITPANGFVIRATDGQMDINFGGYTYFAAKYGRWKRGQITSEANFDMNSNEMELTFTDLDVDAGGPVMVPQTSSGITLLRGILKGFFDAANVIVHTVYMPTYGDVAYGAELKYQGDIISVKDLDRAKASFGVADMLYRLRQPWPPNVYQSSCRHSLFNGNCALDRTVFRQARTLAAGSTPSTLVVSSAATAIGIDPLPFTQGYVTFTSGDNGGLTFTIREQLSATQFQLDAPTFAPVAAGQTLYLYPGCNKLMSTCSGKYNNLIHFGGQPYTPVPETIL
jgi:uncharacterized phage protein (TIGR02218 family)